MLVDMAKCTHAPSTHTAARNSNALDPFSIKIVPLAIKLQSTSIRYLKYKSKITE
jgi:hypothetical protein